MKKYSLSIPKCEYGYTPEQLQEIFGDDLIDFDLWMSGQTRMLCEEHGGITYSWDVKRYIQGLPVID